MNIIFFSGKGFLIGVENQVKQKVWADWEMWFVNKSNGNEIKNERIQLPRDLKMIRKTFSNWNCLNPLSQEDGNDVKGSYYWQKKAQPNSASETIEKASKLLFIFGKYQNVIHILILILTKMKYFEKYTDKSQL